MNLLVVEDERELSSALERILKKNNYNVDTAFDGIEALEYLDAVEYDCVILDVMMPRMDGIEVVQKLRAKGNAVPIIMLTAKAEIDDKVNGLDAGADDYLPKPFSMRELLARIRALTRRKSDLIADYNYANMKLDAKNYELSSDNGSVRLTSKEYQMLEMLVNNPNMLISTERFMENIWGYDTDSEINVVWVYISSVRKKLAQVGAKVIVKAVRGLGYKLEEIN